MPRLPGISRTTMLLGAPVLLTQGLRVRRRVPRLPEAASPIGRVEPGGEPAARQSNSQSTEPAAFHVVLLGDSVTAGVGVDDHANSMAGQLVAMPPDGGRWSVAARSGAASAEIATLAETTPALPDADLVVLSVGVNDVLGMASDAAWRTNLERIVTTTERRAATAQLVMLSVPPMDMFPSLPKPLAQLLGARSRRLDAIASDVLRGHPRMQRVPLDEERVGELAEPFAADGFHPSAALHSEMAQAIWATGNSLPKTHQ